MIDCGRFAQQLVASQLDHAFVFISIDSFVAYMRLNKSKS